MGQATTKLEITNTTPWVATVTATVTPPSEDPSCPSKSALPESSTLREIYMVDPPPKMLLCHILWRFCGGCRCIYMPSQSSTDGIHGRPPTCGWPSHCECCRPLRQLLRGRLSNYRVTQPQIQSDHVLNKACTLQVQFDFGVVDSDCLDRVKLRATDVLYNKGSRGKPVQGSHGHPQPQPLPQPPGMSELCVDVLVIRKCR